MTTRAQATAAPPRLARIKGGARTRREVEAYLPSNYTTIVVETYPERDPEWCEPLGQHVEDDDGRPVIVQIVGTDVAGWTLDGYVIPRLASGLIWAEEVPS